MFNKESEMQKWLSEKLSEIEGLSEIIEDYKENPDESTTEESQIIKSFLFCLKSLDINTVISEDQNISLTKGRGLKPDFLLYSPETESIAVLELKNIANPTREVGTEFSAYTGEIKRYLPFMSDGDIIHVVISREWPTLLRTYISHEIFWMKRNILCLEPFQLDHGEIKLRVVESSRFANEEVKLKLSSQHITGYQLCLYDDELYKEGTRERLDCYLQQIKTSIKAMSSKGITQNSHGFAFLWKDYRPHSLSPYNITLVSIAPFELFKCFTHQNIESAKIKDYLMTLINEYDPMGQGESLYQITQYGFRFLDKVCKPRIEGFHDWSILRDIMLENSKVIEFHSWGFFLDMFTDRLAKEYEVGNHHIEVNDPALGLKFVEDLIN